MTRQNGASFNDANEVIKIANKTKDLHGAIWNTPTIIEADKAESENAE